MSDEPGELNEQSVPYGMDLPVAPAWFSEAPEGSMNDGICLSIAVLETVKSRPEIFEERARQMVDVEFIM